MALSIRALRELKPGGFADNLAAMGLWGGLMLSHPALPAAGALGGALGGLASLAGASWFARRIDGLFFRQVLESEVRIRSDSPPNVASGGGMHIGYTVDTGEPVIIPWGEWVRHIAIAGMTGVGKTVFGEWAMLQQIVNGGGLLWIDGKLDSDNLVKLDAMCAWAGRRADLLVINPGDPDNSNTYNPILHGDADEVAARCLSLIPSSESNPATDYYRQSANQGLTTLVGAIQAAKMAYSFIDLSILLSNQRTLQHLDSIVPPGDARKALLLFLDQYKTQTRDGQVSIDLKRLKEVFGGMAGRLHIFGSGTFGKVTGSYSPEVNLFDAVVNNKIVYVALPTMGKKEAASNFGKIVVGDLRTAVSWAQKLPAKERPWPPFLVFADEAGSYATPAWSTLFEQARSASIAMMPAIQTKANLDMVSDDFTETVIGNTATKIIFKIGTEDTAQFMSELIGKERAVMLTTSVADGLGLNRDPTKVAINSASMSDSFGLTEREDEVERVSADTLKALGKGEAIVNFDGNKVYHVRIPRVTFDPAFLKEIGPFRLNRMRRKYVQGLDYFRDVGRWVSIDDD